MLFQFSFEASFLSKLTLSPQSVILKIYPENTSIIFISVLLFLNILFIYFFLCVVGQFLYQESGDNYFEFSYFLQLFLSFKPLFRQLFYRFQTIKTTAVYIFCRNPGICKAEQLLSQYIWKCRCIKRILGNVLASEHCQIKS